MPSRVRVPGGFHQECRGSPHGSAIRDRTYLAQYSGFRRRQDREPRLENPDHRAALEVTDQAGRFLDRWISVVPRRPRNRGNSTFRHDRDPEVHPFRRKRLARLPWVPRLAAARTSRRLLWAPLLPRLVGRRRFRRVRGVLVEPRGQLADFVLEDRVLLAERRLLADEPPAVRLEVREPRLEFLDALEQQSDSGLVDHIPVDRPGRGGPSWPER